ncbi:MAG: hypothetical protein MR928_07980 [Bacteroidales bacterium]|nr:hypothetical protein [Bacteroidales bacterium]
MKYHVPTIAQRRWLNPISAKLRQNQQKYAILAKFCGIFGATVPFVP